MAWRLAVAGDVINTDDLNQIVRAVNGVAGYGQRFQLTQLNDVANYVLDVQNLDPANSYGLRVRDDTGADILLVNKVGITLSKSVVAFDAAIGDSQVTPAGLFGEDLAHTDTFALLNTATVLNAEALEAGDVLLGLNTGVAHNVLWDASTGKMIFRLGITPYVTIDAHGAITMLGDFTIVGDIQTNAGQTIGVYGVKPTSVGTTPGTAATPVVDIVGPAGGDTTLNTTAVAGAGGNVGLRGGAGGIASAAATSSTGGAGGGLFLEGGAGGLADEVGADIGGAGGAVTVQAGVGGAATVGATKQGGVGGAVYVLAGDAGATTALNVAGGAVEIQSGEPQGAGASVVEIGTDHVTSLLMGKAGAVIGITGTTTHTGAFNLTGALTLVGNLGITGDIIVPVGQELQISGTQPASVGTTPGTAAYRVFWVDAPRGGDTTIATTGVGGTGSRIDLVGGIGGVAASADVSSTGGDGGSVSLNGGIGGNANAAGLDHGGVGGSTALAGGKGGDATVGTHQHGGAGGIVWITGGQAGTGLEAANGGDVRIDSGIPTGLGTSTILIGVTNATNIEVGVVAKPFKVRGMFGCNNAVPQAAAASGGALAGYVTGAFGLDSNAHMQAMFDLVVAMRACLVLNGIMS